MRRYLLLEWPAHYFPVALARRDWLDPHTGRVNRHDCALTAEHQAQRQYQQPLQLPHSAAP